MKARLLFIVVVVFFTFFSGTGWAIENPVGSGTIPPSSVRSGLIRSPNPIDTSSNLVVTGNVSGGKHFRGVVPYNAISDFGGRLGSSSLDSFLRRSADPGYFSRYAGGYKPNYSPSKTVTTTMPGRSGVIRPSTAKISSRVADEFTLLPLPKKQDLSGRDTTVSDIGFRPMSMSPQEMERAVLGEIGRYPRGGELTAEQRQAWVEQFWRDLTQVSDKAAEFKQSLVSQDASLRLSTESSRAEMFRNGLKRKRQKSRLAKISSLMFMSK